jgi:hypothetical protein
MRPRLPALCDTQRQGAAIIIVGAIATRQSPRKHKR